nr:RHS repeat-associated core domain-containing protein [Candidatus Electrothrix aestuarii]
MYQKKYRHILFILFTVLLSCSGSTGFSLAASSGNAIEKKMDLTLPKEVLTSGSPFMMMMDSRGHKRVITYNKQPKKKLSEIHSETFKADTMAVYAADSTMALTDVASAAASALPSERIFKTGGDYQQKIVGEHQILEVTVKDENDNAVPNTQVVFQVAKGGGTLVGASTEPLTVTTDIDGKASAELILGIHTADNPIGWVEAGLNTQQVGLNVVECWPASIPSYKTIFSAYGIPGEPYAIKLHTEINDASSMVVNVLEFADISFVSVVDENENPISNLSVSINAGDILSLGDEGCDVENIDDRPALVLPVETRDEPPPYAYEQYYNQYAGNPLILTSNYTPTPFITYAGGVPYSQYNIDLTVSGYQLQESFSFKTMGRINYYYGDLGNCSGYDAPGSRQWWSVYGSHKQNADDEIELFYWFYEFIEEDQVVEQCGDCYDIVGNTTYRTGTTYANLTVTRTDTNPDEILESEASEYGHVFKTTVNLGDSSVTPSIIFTFWRFLKLRESTGTGCYCTTTYYTSAGRGDSDPVTPFSITIDPTTTVAVDGDGVNLCDTEVPFFITPESYQPDVIYLNLYEEGSPFATIPVDPQTAASPVIPREMDFDLSKSYTADISIELYDTYGEYKVFSSNQTALDLSQEDPIDYLYIENLKEKIPVMQGEHVTIQAQTSPEELVNDLEWSIVARHPYDEKQKINAEIDPTTGVLTVFEDSGNGTVTVRASYSGCVYKDAEVPVGCQECSEGYCPMVTEGSNSNRLGSVEFAISLGKTTDGNPAGTLLLRSETVSAQLYSPEALYLSSLVKDNEVLYDGNDALRQILTAKTFVDITTENEYRYTVSLYRPDDIAGQVDGLYTLNPAAVPFVSFQIENPDMLPTVSERLRITETRGSNSSVTEYFNDKDTGAWTLSEANGERITERSEQVVGDTIVRRETVKNGSGQISAVYERTYKKFPWGEELLSQADDPDGDNLVTTFTYYEDSNDSGSYSKLQSVENPDGSWEYYEYDSQGRITSQYSSWLDLDISQRANARVTSYNYDSTILSGDAKRDEDKSQPRIITEKIGGIVTSLRYAVYSTESGGKKEIHETAISQSASYGSASNLRTVTVYYPEDSSVSSGRLKSVLSPDGQFSAQIYEAGNFDPATQVFTPGSGSYERVTVTHGTESSPAGIALKTTKEESITDSLGNGVFQRTLIFDGGAYQPVSWTAQEFDEFGRVVSRTASDGTETSTDWSCCVKNYETDAAGVTTNFTHYDGLHRLLISTREAEQGDIITNYSYDASGRRLSETVTSGSLSLGSSSTYDLSGRITSRTDSRNLTTGYGYTSGGRITTETRPGNITEITETYWDGRTKSVIGSGVVPRFYTYGVNSDGSTWTQVHSGSVASPVWEKTTTDLAGRTVKTEKPGYLGTETIASFYNDKGQLWKTSTLGLADTLYVYDEVGNRTRSGLDIDSSGALETASDDRISGSETMYTLYDGEWWIEETRSIFAESGSSTETVTGRTRTRLTGLGVGNLVSETMSEDIHSNETVSSRYINRTSHTITEITDYPDSDTDAVQESIYGLLKSSTDKSGITTTFQYDALERRTGVTDPRTGQSITHYNALGQVDYTEDAATKRTEYGYDPITGRKSSVTDAENRTVYFLYDDLDRVTHTWGATSPVRYEYDGYGRMDTMYTWRSGGEGWDTPLWPSANDPLADITRWHYHEATGLLESKEDAQHHQTLYSYIENGKLYTRTWARNSASLVTTYSYDINTGELTGIDYSDTTPDIGFTYYRSGQRHTVSDAVGTRTFTYTTALQPDSESITGLISRTLTRSYETTGVIGRNTGFSTDSSYAVTYGYDNTGRFNGVSWNVGTHSDTVQYGYEPNSHLLHTTTFSSGALVTNSYEPHRNLKTSVLNTYNATTISQYAYTHDDIGRRKTMTTSGDAFSISLPVPPDQKLVNTGTYTSVGYTANDLNQYTSVETNNGAAASPAYDNDGDLTDDGTFIYTWNGENRLSTVTPKTPAVSDEKLEFLYDYMGRRARKITTAWDGSTWQSDETRFFVYDGWNLIEELDGAGAVTASYIHGLDLSQSLQGAGGIGGILARVDHGTDKVHLYFYDANGNVGQLIDTADGSVVAAYEYAPFGGLTSAMGTYATTSPFRFSSKYADDVTGLYYYGYRYYSPRLGRWLSRDPIGEEGGINLYGFVGNDGGNAIDPAGHETWIDINGIVICNPSNQNDNGIYQYTRGGWGPAAPVGESYFWDTFEKGSKIFMNRDKTNDFFELAKSTEWIPDTIVALESRSGKKYDPKVTWGYKPTSGFVLNGKYATVRDIGNALAGLNARIGATPFKEFQRMAGAVHQKKGLTGIALSYFGKEYGPAPTYGEINLQYRMSIIGYNELYDAYKKWKRKWEQNATKKNREMNIISP